MSADMNFASSSAQLAERLEKSEAGRKKLRQAISILQEKLAASEKLFKVNDNLQHECELERQRAESEKKKAEEEKRLRAILEKDSATVKDQLAKVFERLGAVENKQKADKKEVERLRNEVKLSVEGMRVATQAVDAIQSSFQSLENNLLEKVNAAFKEAHTASEGVHQLQISFRSLENTAIKKGSLPDNQLLLSTTKPVSEKLVEEISRLFHKEKQSHCKIEQRLSKLKSVLKLGKWNNSFTTAENFDLENLGFSKMAKEKVSKKRKPRGEEELLNWKARKRAKLYDVDIVNSAVNRPDVDVPKEANDGQSMSSPFSIEYQVTSEEPGFVLRMPNTASSEYIEEAIVNHRGSSNGKIHMQIPPVGGKAQKESQKSSFAQWEKIDRSTDVKKGCLKNTCLQNEGITEMQSDDGFKIMQHRSVNQLACQEESEASDLDLNFDDSDDEWWSKDRLLLSPSLPEIPSPVHHSPFCSRGPSLSGADNHTASATLEFDLYSSAMLEVPVSESHVLTEASCSRVEEQHNKVESSTDCQLVHADDHTEGGGNGDQCKRQSVKLNQVAGNSVSETDTGAVESSGKETKSLFHEACPSLDPISATKFGPENFISSDNEGKDKEFQFDDKFGFEAVDSVTITEINNFLEVLPPISSTFSNESCACDLPAGAMPCEIIGASDEICTSAHPQAACEMQTWKAINMKISGATDCSGEESCDGIGLQQVTNLSQTAQGLPIQDESHTFKDTRTHFVSEIVNSSDPQAVRISSSQHSNTNVVFLLQAFDLLHGLDAELNVIAACITAINFKAFLQATRAKKQEMQLEGAILSRASACVPTEYLACSFISAVVDMVRLGNVGEHCSSEAKSIPVLVQALVSFISSMFKETAGIILDTTFSQLGRFLIQGEAMLITLHGSIGSCQDVLSFARMFQDPKHHSHQYTEATLEDIYAGGKVLAALCQVLSCVTHLQNIVYEVLGWCDKDIMWLLTVFSSFSSICGNTAFMVEADDLLGHAICAIILELVASVEQEPMKSAEGTIHKATKNSVSMSSDLSLGWSALKESLEVNGNMTVEEVFLAVFEALRYIFSSTRESLALSSQPILEDKLLFTKECCNNNTRPWQGTDSYDEEAVKDPVACQEVSIICKTLPKALYEKQVDAALGSKKWQKKYGDAVGALQLIVHFMGWEWAYNHLIIRYLWREAVSGSAQLCAAAVSHILSVLWRMGVQGGGTELPGLAELKKCLVHIVQSTMRKADSSLPFDLQ